MSLFDPGDPHEDSKKFLVAKIKEIVDYEVSRQMEARLPQLLKESLDRQRETVADEVVKILVADLLQRSIKH